MLFILKLIADAGIDETTVFEQQENGNVSYRNNAGQTVIVPKNNNYALNLVIPNTPHGELVAQTYNEGDYNSVSVDVIDKEEYRNTLVIVEDVCPDVETPCSYGLSSYVFGNREDDDYAHKIEFKGI